jgi:glycosyltransferase involved in cell wall biosynthesis
MAGMRRLLGRLQRRRPFDLVHQLNPVDVGLSLAVADVRLPVVLGPYVPDWPPTGEGADAVVSPPVLRLKRVLRAAQQRRAAMVLLSTPAAAARLEGSWPGRLRVREVPPGIDAARWAPAAAPAAGDDAEDVLFLANLQVRKGIMVALQAFDRVAAQRPSARLLVAGDGPEAAAVRRLAAASPARERIALLGAVTREQALPLMQACSVFCAPSFAEPFGMNALEAMACARPVVATRAGGLQHLVDERGGLVVAPGDAAALAAALDELLARPGLRAQMGAHNRRLVRERYDWTAVVDRLERAYAEALRRRR